MMSPGLMPSMFHRSIPFNTHRAASRPSAEKVEIPRMLICELSPGRPGACGDLHAGNLSRRASKTFGRVLVLDGPTRSTDGARHVALAHRAGTTITSSDFLGVGVERNIQMIGTAVSVSVTYPDEDT